MRTVTLGYAAKDGGVLRIPVYLDAVGDEANIQLGVAFDPAKYSFKYFVLSDAPVGTGPGSSSSSNYAAISVNGYQPFSPGRHTVGEIAFDIQDPNDTALAFTYLDGYPNQVTDASGNQLDATFVNLNDQVGYSVTLDPPVPIGAVIDPTTGEVTVGHIDPATGQVHVATRPQTGATKDDGTIFGFSPLMLGVIAVGAFFLLKK